MIKKFNLSRVRLMEFFQTMTNIKSFVDKENAKELGIETAKSVFDTKLTALDEALKPLAKSELTQKLHQLDRERDDALVGFLGHCRAFAHFPEEAKSQAAQKLLLNAEKYGKNIQNKPLKEETAIITNLLQDLSTSELQQAVSIIGAEKWIENLRTANEAFAKIHNDRTQEQSLIETGKTKEARQELQEAFKVLVQTINALAVINGKEKYQNVINLINEEIK